ncbi:MAG: hypothetical protein QM595_09545 [Nocardioides sp.]
MRNIRWRESGERFGEYRVGLFVLLADVDALEERLVGEALAVVVGLLVRLRAAGEQAHRGGDVLAVPGVFLVLAVEFAVDLGKAGADAVLVAFEGLEVDGVGEVRGEELVGLVVEAFAVRGELGEFLGLGREALIERRVDLGGEVVVGLLADPDPLVAGGDEVFGDADGNSLAVAVGGLAGSTCADVVRVLHAGVALGERELEPGVAGGAVQGAFEVVLVPAVADLGAGA